METIGLTLNSKPTKNPRGRLPGRLAEGFQVLEVLVLFAFFFSSFFVASIGLL